MRSGSYFGTIPYLTTSAILRLSQNPETSVVINSAVDYMVLAAITFSLSAMVYKDLKRTRQPEPQEVAENEGLESTSGLWRPLVAGAGSGIVIGATGVGGGVLLLPILTVLLRVNIKEAVGSSIVIALLLSALSALTYGGGGQADMTTAVLLVIGSLVGVPVAGLVMKLVSDKTLHRLTLALITLSAVMMFSTSLS